MSQDQKLETHLQQFHEWGKNQPKISDNSIENYKSSVKRFYKQTGIPPIKPDQINQEKLEQLSDLVVTGVTSRSMKFGLKKYFDFLSLQASNTHAESHISFLSGKLDKMDLEPEPRDIESMVISGERVGVVAGKAQENDEELGLLYRMMYETATRASGMYLLEWRDVDREEYAGETIEPHEIFISKERSKGKVSGTVEVSDKTLKELEDLRKNREDVERDDHVFFPEMTRGSVYKKIWRVTKDLEISPHWFRHSRLVHLGMEMYEEEGLDYDTIKGRLQRYARHRDSKTTEENYIEIVKKKVTRKNRNMEKYRQVDW